MNNIYCVIMAGGKGERFWPCSRENTPKQLQSILGGETLIEQTVLRLIPLTGFENILIITNEKYTDQIRHLLPQLPLLLKLSALVLVKSLMKMTLKLLNCVPKPLSKLIKTALI